MAESSNRKQKATPKKSSPKEGIDLKWTENPLNLQERFYSNEVKIEIRLPYEVELIFCDRFATLDGKKELTKEVTRVVLPFMKYFNLVDVMVALKEKIQKDGAVKVVGNDNK